jgi:hypothetical protein
MTDEAKQAPIITRQSAKAQNLTRYFTGKPCNFGHVAERLTCNTHCVECSAGYLRTHYTRNRESILASKKEYYRNNSEAIKQRSRDYRARKAAEKAAQTAPQP